MSASDPPIGFVLLFEAVDAVGGAVFGLDWKYAVPVDDPIGGAHGNAIKLVAEGCEDGRLVAVYRSITGVDELDPAVWRSPVWCNYFMDGMITLDLPLLDERGRPTKDGFTARCEREIFIRRDSLTRFVAGLGQAQSAAQALGPASEVAIRTEIRAVYLETAADPPNINQLPKIVRSRLNALGVDASDRQIKKIGEEAEFARRRRPVGKRR